LCEEQADAVRQSPHWTSGWRDALEAGELLEREFAAQAIAAGLQEDAATLKSAADKLHKDLQYLPPDN
jgi:DNA-binding GntR family transcriptional regulator